MNSLKTAGLLVVLSAMASLYVISRLPADMTLPVHWGLNGEPDATASATIALLLPPGIMLVLTVLIATLRYLEPRKQNLEQSRVGIQAIFWALMVLFLALEAGYLGLANGYQVPMFQLIISALGVAFIIMGNYFGKVRSNYFIGIKTPWTLSSDAVWQKTHRLAGKLAITAGLISAVLVWILPADFAGILVIGLLVPSILLPAMLSWWFWRTETRTS
ncbi:MAG: DUF1648 domain-containing protein [Alteromonadaceae bacterium TMED7]|nr:hypothetical protein [Alteromonadaceae bacterium]MCP4863958.1 DUF1648 domain-containing protein [Alteromonas sp.]RPH16767.1 MAG: DUF1648 domain-containing protein [Alteromonadaceae bacterium TMED7]|tara:strand:- start:26233 stop:26883 length:651 start_codon:yes stop_codon:yes gene_type:complete